MSEFRDSLSDATRHRCDEAISGFAEVARLAYVPAGPSIEELAEGYEVLAEQPRQR